MLMGAGELVLVKQPPQYVLIRQSRADGTGGYRTLQEDQKVDAQDDGDTASPADRLLGKIEVLIQAVVACIWDG